MAMADSNMLNVYLAATHRLMLPLDILRKRFIAIKALIAKTYYRGLSRELSHRGQPPQMTRVSSSDPDTNAATVVKRTLRRERVFALSGVKGVIAG